MLVRIQHRLKAFITGEAKAIFLILGIWEVVARMRDKGGWASNADLGAEAMTAYVAGFI